MPPGCAASRLSALEQPANPPRPVLGIGTPPLGSAPGNSISTHDAPHEAKFMGCLRSGELYIFRKKSQFCKAILQNVLLYPASDRLGMNTIGTSHSQ